jgi:carboxyl-terminal processing protease
MESPVIDHPDRQAVSVGASAAVSDQTAVADVTTRRRIPMVPLALAGVAVLAGSALFLSGYTLGRQTAAEPGTPADDPAAFRPFWDTYHTINDRYAGGTVDRDRMVQGAIRGMIDSLADPYSAYLTSDEYRASLQGISGEFEGIGADLASQATDGSAGCATIGPTCRLVIVRPLGGSPAERAGLLPGDRVLAADGVPFDGLSVDAARARIRGPKGTVLELSIVRGEASPFELSITRDVILQPEVESRVLAGGSVGFVHLKGFSDRSATDFATAVGDQVAAGRRRLIIDLRGDPGGYVTAARQVASQFIGSGTIFWEQDARGGQTPTQAIPGGAATDRSIQVVCLIDHGSASASEIVAAALQDTGRATLVGQRSFGKGTVQQWQELAGEGGAFRLTVARWLSPANRWIPGVGLAPDVTVALPAGSPPGADPTLDRALELLAPTATPLVP